VVKFLKLSVLLFTLLILEVRTVYTQINFYSRIEDPRAIARLDCPDCQPLRYVNRFGYPPDRDPIDSNFIFAQDTGAGVITHIWMTTTAPDSTTNFKIYIDGNLISSSTFVSFFVNARGVLRPPFDSLYPGAFVCDVQIPYKKSFKITYIGEGWNVYYAIAWRPISDPSGVVSFQESQPYAIQYHQQDAEALYEQRVMPWSKEKPLISYDTTALAPGAKKTVFDTVGPAMIQKLNFAFPNYDFDELDSLWINMYWDGSPYPAVHVPLADFFCSSNGGINIHSLAIRNDSNGLTSYFPMPFALRGKIELVNECKRILQLRTSVSYSLEVIDKKSYGYFCAHFSESNPTRYHVYHKVLHERGMGKVVGFYHYAPHNTDGVVLEGDPVFTIDSNSRNNFRYTGGEDYYNSGWWFLGQVFTKPFAGHLNFFQSFYRFQFLDAIDFTKSIDFDLQPGGNTDFEGHFRTIVYYYKRPISFWVSLDTIKAGEHWNVAGAGYKPNSTIVAKFDSTETIFTTTTNASGEFSAYLIVPVSKIHGPRIISINNEVRPEPVYVISSPAIRPIADTIPLTLRYGDSLLVTGTGFDPGERVQIYLDSILISDSAVIVGGDYRFLAKVRMPHVAEWKYHLRAMGDHHNEAMANELITITRILPFEFEDLLPWAVADTGWLYAENLSSYWGSKWSKQAIAVFQSLSSKEKVRFKFFSTVSDTFDVKLALTKGVKYGIYSYSLDGNQLGIFNGYKFKDWDDDLEPSDTMDLGKIFITRDTHMFFFTCLGKDTAAKEFRLGADLLLLTPTTKMALPKGVFTTPPGDTTLSGIDSPGVLDSYLVLYPNPIGKGELTLGMNFPPGRTADGKLDIILSDIIGRKLLWQYDLPMTEFGATTQFDVRRFPVGNYVAEFILHSGGEIRRISRMLQIRE